MRKPQRQFRFGDFVSSTATANLNILNFDILTSSIAIDEGRGGKIEIVTFIFGDTDEITLEMSKQDAILFWNALGKKLQTFEGK